MDFNGNKYKAMCTESKNVICLRLTELYMDSEGSWASVCQVEGKSLCSWVLKIRYGGIIETVAAGLFQVQNLPSFKK